MVQHLAFKPSSLAEDSQSLTREGNNICSKYSGIISNKFVYIIYYEEQPQLALDVLTSVGP